MPSCAWACSAEIPLEWLVIRWIASNQVRSGSLLRCMTVPAVTDVWRWPTGAFPGERFGIEFPALAGAADGAGEAIRPPELREMAGARALVRKSTIEVAPRHWTIMLPTACHKNITGT